MTDAENASKAMQRMLTLSRLMTVQADYTIGLSKNKSVNNLLRRLAQANTSITEDLMKQFPNREDVKKSIEDDSTNSIGAILEYLLMFTPETIAEIEDQIAHIYNESKPKDESANLPDDTGV